MYVRMYIVHVLTRIYATHRITQVFFLLNTAVDDAFKSRARVNAK